MPSTTPFRSFWMGGFEGADHHNSKGVPLDMAEANGHGLFLASDYEAAARLGIRTLRESIGWRLAEPAPGEFDFRRMRRAQEAADRAGVQLVWTLMHYGMPADLCFFDDRMVQRFVAFAGAAATVLKPLHETAPVYNLINEINFIAWAVSATSLIHPYDNGAAGVSAAALSRGGYDVKQRLVRATLAAMDVIREIDPRARFMHTEPVIHIAAPRGEPQLQSLADEIGAFQWQAWDMLAGREAPELGGHHDALDVIGVNHYHSGQWEVRSEERLWWHERDERRRPLADLLAGVWQRYGRPLIIAETGHVGEGRAAWLDEVASDVARSLAAGVPVDALCLYPLVDRPDWEDPEHWHHSGLWDVPQGPWPAQPPRQLHTALFEALHAWQQRLP